MYCTAPVELVGSEHAVEQVDHPFDMAGEPSAESSESSYQVMLVKHGQRYVFRYAPGEELKLMKGLADMARDPHCDLDWFDAAVLSHQMGQGIGQKLDQILKH